MSAQRYDLAVIGGGIHGVGVLQAAAAASHTALLVEERAIAAGTSSRSSKLIHGGLRYLERAHLGLVRESLRERAILLRIAPDLVRLVPFHIPIYRDTKRRAWQIRAGLSLYALLGNLARDARFRSVPRDEWSDLDGLSTDGLQAVFQYHDGQTDDAALARAVLRSAVDLGAHVAMPAQFSSATRRPDGYTFQYSQDGKEIEVHAGALVNAAGPWINRVRDRITPQPPGVEVELVGGAHIEIEGAIERGIYYTEAPRDGRAVFTMPWKGHTLVGTTETPFDGDPADVKPLASEIEYLEETHAHYFPRSNGRKIDAWAGLRVLPKGAGSAFDRPRETTLVCDDERAPRLVAIYGGKLTGYRATALKVMDRLKGALPEREPRARTDNLPLC